MERIELATRLGETAHGSTDPVVICEPDNAKFRRALGQASAGLGPVFLANPGWGQIERDQFTRLIDQSAADWDSEKGWLMIPTGGSSGRIKLARHDQNTLMAAIDGYRHHWGGAAVNAAAMLPLCHVGGLMSWLRCALTAGEYRDLSWNRVKAARFPDIEPDRFSLSVVPTQLARLMSSRAGMDWLRQFPKIFVGGARLGATLTDQARRVKLRLSPSYGATETAAMVMALPPDEFLQGKAGVGRALPHAQLELTSTGELQVRSPALFRGYWPKCRNSSKSWPTRDLGRVSERGYWTILGRADDLILTGAEQVNLHEVEKIVREISGFENVALVGLPDPEWGERVVLCHDGCLVSHRFGLESSLREKLADCKRPKEWLLIHPWPMNHPGKLNRGRLRELAAAASATR